MSRLTRTALVAAVGAVFAFTAIASEVLEPITSSQGGVTVKVAPRNLAGRVWEFDVVMDTHTQPLTDDLARSAVLVTPQGEVAPASWSGDGPGGHHRRGVLRFKAPPSRSPTITIRLIRPGEPQARSFQWERK